MACTDVVREMPSKTCPICAEVIEIKSKRSGSIRAHILEAHPEIQKRNDYGGAACDARLSSYAGVTERSGLRTRREPVSCGIPIRSTTVVSVANAGGPCRVGDGRGKSVLIPKVVGLEEQLLIDEFIQKCKFSDLFYSQVGQLVEANIDLFRLGVRANPLFKGFLVGSLKLLADGLDVECDEDAITSDDEFLSAPGCFD